MVTKKETQICQFTVKSVKRRMKGPRQKVNYRVIWTQEEGGGTPYNGPYGEAPPERGTFFRPQVYEGVGILLVEVYERVGRSVIWVCERAQKG